VAVDDGGPTRVFVSEVWRQLPALKAHHRGFDVSLFDSDQKGGNVTPCGNDWLQSKFGKNAEIEEIRAALRPYYRAVGRIMLHCFFHDIPLAAHTMPPLLRHYLLRGVSPIDKGYPLSDLVTDVVKMTNLSSADNPVVEFVEMCGDDEEAENTEDNFRLMAHKRFIEESDISLEALKEGLTLDGTFGLPSNCLMI
jgi:hypothetical protein